jgi:hypothetical protein
MQKTVETSTYGSELVAARIATDIATELRYNIRMMGFELDGPVNMFGDNQSVVLNTTIPSSQLKKKIHDCAYHRVREIIIIVVGVSSLPLWTYEVVHFYLGTKNMLKQPSASSPIHLSKIALTPVALLVAT